MFDTGSTGFMLMTPALAFFMGINSSTPFSNGKIPEYIFIAYQMMFAIITPALITGTFTGRVTFKAYLIFLILWQLLVYYLFVHMIWGGEILQQWGILDFEGSIVVHISAGFAALASVFFVGKRKDPKLQPNNIPLVAIGTGLLWFGWYGFNAGSELNVDHITVTAFLNTDIAASFATVTWLIIEGIKTGRPKFAGLMTGAAAGLATITPAAGYVPVWAAAIIGIIASLISYFAVEFKNRYRWDDALDVWGVRGVGGFTGTVLLGVFASKTLNAAGTNGLIHGGSSFFLKQLLIAAATALYAFLFTYVMLWLINKITRVRVTEEEETFGLDRIHKRRRSIHINQMYFPCISCCSLTEEAVSFNHFPLFTPVHNRTGISAACKGS